MRHADIEDAQAIASYPLLSSPLRDVDLLGISTQRRLFILMEGDPRAFKGRNAVTFKANSGFRARRIVEA